MTDERTTADIATEVAFEQAVELAMQRESALFIQRVTTRLPGGASHDVFLALYPPASTTEKTLKRWLRSQSIMPNPGDRFLTRLDVLREFALLAAKRNRQGAPLPDPGRSLDGLRRSKTSTATALGLAKRIKWLGFWIGAAGAACLAGTFVIVLLSGGWPSYLRPMQSAFAAIHDIAGSWNFPVLVGLFVGPGGAIYWLGSTWEEEAAAREKYGPRKR